MAADLSAVYTALRNADATGDAAGAQQLAAYIKSQSGPSLAQSNPGEYDPNSPEYQANYGATSGMGTTDKVLAGAGKAFVDTGRGLGQFVGAESRQDVADSRALDAPLMATGAGKIGNLIGNIAVTAPALAIPGVATVRGAALLGGALGAAQPSTSTQETLTNTGLGALTGGAGQKLAGMAAGRLASRTAEADALAAQNAERDAVWKEARAVGYSAPPTALKASATNTVLESVAGKAATRQGLSAKNAAVTNAGVREDLGLAKNAPITRQVLKSVRATAGKAYQDVKNALASGFKSDTQYGADLDAIQSGIVDLEKAYPGISSQANPEVEALIKSVRVAEHSGPEAIGLSKFLRSEAKNNYQAAFGQNGNPTKLALSRAQTAAAGALEDLIERTLQKSGQGDLSTAWNSARTTIAKSYQAEGALKGGNVSAAKLAQQMQKGKPVSGRMGLAARFADHFEEAAKLPKSGVGVSKLGASLVGAGAVGGIALGSPAALLGSLAIPATSYATRAGILSRAGQNLLANPSYAPGMIGTGTLNSLKALGRTAIPAGMTTNALVQSAQ